MAPQAVATSGAPAPTSSMAPQAGATSEMLAPTSSITPFASLPPATPSLEPLDPSQQAKIAHQQVASNIVLGIVISFVGICCTYGFLWALSKHRYAASRWTRRYCHWLPHIHETEDIDDVPRHTPRRKHRKRLDRKPLDLTENVPQIGGNQQPPMQPQMPAAPPEMQEADLAEDGVIPQSASPAQADANGAFNDAIPPAQKSPAYALMDPLPQSFAYERDGPARHAAAARDAALAGLTDFRLAQAPPGRPGRAI